MGAKIPHHHRDSIPGPSSHITYDGQQKTISKQDEKTQTNEKALHGFQYYGCKEMYLDKEHDVIPCNTTTTKY
jgi:hypothetical protein